MGEENTVVNGKDLLDGRIGFEIKFVIIFFRGGDLRFIHYAE